MTQNELNSKNIKDIYKLSPMQEGIFFHTQLTQDSQAYFSQTAYRFYDYLSVELVEKTLNELMKRHDILRTVFNHKKTDSILQIVLKERKIDFQFEDLTQMATDAQETYLKSFRQQDRVRGFDLTKDTLIRVSLLQIGATSFEFIWSNHHILMDGWCTGILIQEFTKIYSQLKDNSSVNLPQVGQYRDFIKWIEQQNITQTETYWKDYLSGIENVTEISTHKNTDKNNYENCEVALQLSDAMTQKLQEIASTNKVTTNVILQTLWGMLLARYNDSKDVVFGSVVTVRPKAIADVENIVGLFINTLPTRIHYNDSTTFEALIQQVQQENLVSEPHQYFPLNKIQSLSEVGNNLINHVFIFENFPVADMLNSSGMKASFSEGFAQTNYDFNVIVVPEKNLKIRFNFNGNVFPKAFVESLKDNMAYLLVQALQAPQTLIESFELMPSQVKNSLLEVNSPAFDLNFSRETFDEIFQRNVENNPNALALITNQERWTYSQVNEKVSIVAQNLLEKTNLKAGEVVALWHERSVEALCSILAVWRLGATYLPIDVKLPSERIAFLLAETKAKTLITQSDFTIDFDFDGFIITSSFLIEKPEFTSNISSINNSESVAYILFTSGTTGKPKGVPVRHVSLTNRILYHVEALKISNSDVVSQFASLSFDASMVEIGMAWGCGATLLLIEDETKYNLEKLVENFNQHQVSLAILPPAYLKEISQSNLPMLTKIITTGEKAALAESLILAKQGKTVINGYGPTETCVGATFHFTDSSDENNYNLNGGLPIGKAFSYTRVYVLDHHNRLVPKGVKGEICVSGLGLSAGYLNQPTITNQKFVENPYACNRFDGMIYKTGDVGFWNENNELEYVGRADDQVQIRGIRVEVGEVENRILQVEAVSQTVVIPQETAQGVNLVAYLTLKKVADIAQIRKEVANFLPAYMIPSVWIVVDKFELTSNGKINKRNLPAPTSETNSTIENKAEILTEGSNEKILTDIFSQVLTRQNVKLTDEFFMLGGDSIKAIQITSRLHRMGLKLEVKDIFNNPQLGDLVSLIKPLEQAIDQSEVSGILPLTPIQAEFLSMDYPNPNTYIQTVMVKSPVRLQESKVRKAFRKLIEHHDALRINLSNENQFEQFNNPVSDQQIELYCFDLQTVETPNEQCQLLAETVLRRFDLQKGSLIKPVIFKMPDHDRLMINVHHWVMDSMSWRVLLEDVATLLEQSNTDQITSLPTKTTSFQQWSKALSVYANSDEFLNQEAQYWKTLSNKTIENLVDKTNKSEFQENKVVQFSLDRNTTNDLLTRTNVAYNTEINDLLLAAFTQAVHKVLLVKNLLICLEGHGRHDFLPDVNIGRTIGWFTNTYPVLFEDLGLSGTDKFIIDTKETLRQIPKKGMGFGLLKYLTNSSSKIECIGSLKPKIVFNYLGQFDNTVKQGFEIIEEEHPHAPVWLSYPLTVSGMILDEKLSFSLKFDNQIFAESTIEELSNCFQTSLVEVVKHCMNKKFNQITISDLSDKSITWSELNLLNEYCYNHIESTVEDIYPMTSMQEGMLFQSLLEPKGDAYFYQVSYKIHQKLVPALVEESMNQLIARHSVLRTVFDYDKIEKLVQLVVKKRVIDFQFEDIRTLCEKDQKRFLGAYRYEDKIKGFDLSKDVLFRISVIQTKDDENVLIWSCHHILMDGWCMGILIREFSAIYASLLQNQALNLPKVFPFKNYLKWLGNYPMEETSQYWKKYLNGYEEPVELPKSGYAHNSDSYQLAYHEWTLSNQATEALKLISSQHKTTLNTLFQTLWGVLLAKYNDVEDVTFGAVVSGRPSELEGVEQMIGLFINTIPVRLNFKSEGSFTELLMSTQRNNTEGESHHHYSLAKLQQEHSLKQSLFDHIIEFENYPISDSLTNNSGGWKVSEIESKEHNNYDFTVVVTVGEELHVKFQYNANVYSQENVNLFENHIRNLAAQVIKNPTNSIKNLSVIAESERVLLTETFNANTPNYKVEQTVTEIFEQSVMKSPKAIAVSCNGRNLTYEQLNHQANQVADYLLKVVGIQPEEKVGVLMERSENLLVSMLGVMKARATYLPLDPTLPMDRIEYILSDTNSRVVLTAKSESNTTLNNYQTLNVTATVLMDTFSNENQSLTYQLTDLAYVIYTSGSTGKPKGVQLEQQGLVNHLLSRIQSFDINPSSKVVQSASQSFDISMWQALSALLAGGTTLIYDKDLVLNPEAFVEQLSNDEATILQVVPTYLVELLHVMENRTEIDLSHLKYMLTIGEILKKSLAEKWFSLYPTIQLVNTYGPTEASDTIAQFYMESLPEKSHISIGKPIHNMSIYIVDKLGQLAPIGVKGELLVGGIGVGRGYLNNPEKNAESFIKNQFKLYERMYRTGDLARWTQDGELEFFGRRDNQVKVRGHRIELGEIEEALMTQDDIENVAVILHQENQIVAYIQTREGFDVQKIKESIVNILPAYAIPSLFIELAHFPLTTSGKIDRKALPVPSHEHFRAFQNEHQSPESPLEVMLVETWEHVLKYPSIGINDNFFELGGDSIKAIQLVAQIQKNGYKVQVKEIFQHPTVALLATILQPLNASEENIYQEEVFEYQELSNEDFDDINALFN
jgi:amino acid adenylation domain-containing protein/non-ribosomal peptide synthase protein (TIGR01720 family)